MKKITCCTLEPTQLPAATNTSMSKPQLFYLIILLFSVFIIGRWFFKRWHFKNAMTKPFPEKWKALLSQRLPVYRNLPDKLQKELQSHIKHFLYKKQFVGCSGFTITDEVRLIIAAEACLLVLNRPSTLYDKLRWIYVYPSTFVAKREVADQYGIVSEGKSHLLGESWQNGRIILAWDSVERGMQNFNDGHNVVLHEFAHQLDQEDGNADGAPLLYTKDSYQIWARIFSDEFMSLQEAVMQGGKSLIDSYGATNPAEFFAVVTEVFFEKPSALKKQHPELYNELSNYYRVQPEEWH